MIPIDLWRARIGLFNCKCYSSFLSSLFSPSPCLFFFHHPRHKRHKVVTEPAEESSTENDHKSHPSNLASNTLKLPGDSSLFSLTKEQTASLKPRLKQYPSPSSATASFSSSTTFITTSSTTSITTTFSSFSSGRASGILFSLRRSLLRVVLIILMTAIIHVSQQLIILSGDIETNPGPKHRVDEKPALNELQYLSIAGEDGETHFRLMERLQVRWRSLAIAFKFPPHSIEAIEHSKNSIYQLLNEWLQGANMEEDPRPVTWRTLIVALREAKFHREADTLEEHFVLTEKSVVVVSQIGKRKHSEVEENQAEGTVSMVHKAKKAKFEDSESCGGMLAHHSSGGYTMSHGPIQVSVKPDVLDSVLVLMKEYAEMLLVLRTAKLSKTKLTTLKTFLSDYCDEFSIRECSTVNSIVDLLIKQLKIYIFNIDTLNASYEYFSSLKVNNSVGQYKQHLDKFLSSTSVKEFKETLQTQIVNPESIEYITLKLDEGRTSDTLKKLKQLVYHFFGNISKTFIHCEMCAGCVCITWLVPISLVPTLRTMAQQLSHEYLASHGVLELVIGLRIAPNDEGSKVKEVLKDDVDMGEFTSQIVSDVKIKKPQSDKEWRHETCYHASAHSMTISSATQKEIMGYQDEFLDLMWDTVRALKERFPDSKELAIKVNEILKEPKSRHVMFETPPTSHYEIFSKLQNEWSYTNPKLLRLLIQRIARKSAESKNPVTRRSASKHTASSMEERMESYCQRYQKFCKSLLITTESRIVFDSKPCLILTIQKGPLALEEIYIFLEEEFDIYNRYFRIHNVDPGSIE